MSLVSHIYTDYAPNWQRKRKRKAKRTPRQKGNAGRSLIIRISK